jgi:hypothetical protein
MHAPTNNFYLKKKRPSYQSCFLVLFGGASYTTQGHVWLSCDLKCVMWREIEEIFIFLLTIEKVEIAI